VTPCASPPPLPSIVWIVFFLSTTLSTGMTGISLHMQWPLTSESHGKSQRNRVKKRIDFRFITNISFLEECELEASFLGPHFWRVPDFKICFSAF
jgi:hypothetical protein